MYYALRQQLRPVKIMRDCLGTALLCLRRCSILTLNERKPTVRLLGATPKLLLVLGLIAAGVALLAWLWTRRHRTESMVPTHSFALHAGHMEEWKPIGGQWQIVDGVMHNDSPERGAKLLAGSSEWRNYTLNSDIRFTEGGVDMGMMIRSNNEMEGVDTYNGYYVGLRNLDGTIVIGRSDFGWLEARPFPMPGGIHPGIWYRMRVTAYQCNLAASVQNLTTLETAWIAFEERSCVESGRIGLRSLNPGGMWRNISVEPADWNSYQDLRRHAAFVERPLVPAGPPWWTPWHVGMLFAAALGMALLTQLIYFRVQQWKAYTITQERERLAHEIHDTMAQSFAGVGYQIQGIRRSVVRGDRQDSRQIADQLSVAYQLVRKCHEEASRTIAMLGSSSPKIQQNLLGSLAETARRIAGNQIRTITRLQGNSIPLNLRLADALLHIGQEAIANAVGHSDPTVLTLTLNYEGKDVELVVEDNGQGFEYTPEKAGFGILGMQKRARDVAGALRILSAPGRGTQVRVTASLQQDKRRKRLFATLKERFMSIPPDFNTP
jgi:signal transduction histidine kinase